MTLILIIISVTCSTVLMRYSLVSPSHSSLSLVWLESSVLVHQISTSIIRVRFLCSHWLSQIILISDWSGPGVQLHWAGAAPVSASEETRSARSLDQGKYSHLIGWYRTLLISDWLISLFTMVWLTFCLVTVTVLEFSETTVLSSPGAVPRLFIK